MFSEKGITRCTFFLKYMRDTESLDKARKNLFIKISNYYSPELLSIEWAGFRDTNTYVLTESRNSKTFLKKIDTIPLDSASFIYSKKCWSWNWKECWWCLCSLHTLDINTMQIKHKMNLTVCKFIKYFKLFLYLSIYKLSIYSLHKTYWLQNTET